MNCSETFQYTARAAAPEGLGALAEEALGDIQNSFQCAVEYGIPTSQLANIRYEISNRDPMVLFLRNPLTSGGRFIEYAKRVYVLNHAEWMANPRFTRDPKYVGQYVYEPAVILLHSIGGTPVLWCRNVLTHETLHSTSLYSRIFSIFLGIVPKHNALIEGITECLNVYVLLKKHTNCYNMVKSSIQGNCQIAYKESTKLFCSLAQLIGIDPIANFYFSFGQEFRAPWDQFINSIHSAGFSRFNYVLDEQTAFREHLFREECVKSITGFRKIYDSDTKALNFSQIR